MDPLKDIHFLNNLSEEARKEIIKRALRRQFRKGDTIVREGEEGDSLFIILSGSVYIYKKNKDGVDTLIDELKQGDFFGEISFLTGKPRTATAVAGKNCELLEIPSPLLEELEERFPEINEVISDFYKIRVLDSLLALSPLFSSLSPEERKFVLAHFYLKIYHENEIITKEGDPGDSLFIIKDGVVGIYTTDPKGEKVKLAELGSGDFFGEVSLITGTPRTATAIALTKVRMLEMTKEDFQKICRIFPSILQKGVEVVKERAEDAIKKIVGRKK